MEATNDGGVHVYHSNTVVFRLRAYNEWTHLLGTYLHEMCASDLNDLAERKASIEERKEALGGQERKRGELRAVAEAIAEFARGFRSKFADGDHLRRKEMIQRCIGGIIIDRTAKMARCYIRPVPLVEGPTGEIIERIENAKGLPESPISLHEVAVPGTGYTLD